MFLKEFILIFFYQALKEILKKKQIEEGILEKLKIHIEKAREEKFGDYAITSAMDRNFREVIGIRNPKELAELWLQTIKEIKIDLQDLSINKEIFLLLYPNKKKILWNDLFESIEIAAPGFINIFIHKKLLFYYVCVANQTLDSYGKITHKDSKKIIFEFVSANPTGPLNIVSARAAALGDSCCNLLEFIGEEVYREYYVNDYGNQVELLGISLLLRYLEKKGVPLKFSIKKDDQVVYPKKIGIPFPSEAYHGEYIIQTLEEILKSEKIEISEQEIKKLLDYSQNQDLDETFLNQILTEELKKISDILSKKAIEIFLQKHKEDLNKFNVRFDNFFKESFLHDSGKVKEVSQIIQSYTYLKDNKLYFKSTDFGDDQDRVIVRENGKPTYLLADIAYHYTKIERKFDKIINIWGPDHHGYIARLKGAMKALNFPEEDFRILIAQQVTLFEDGKPIVMSKRTGKIIQMKELLEEIPVDVARFFFILRSFESPLEFDLNQAKDTSEKNPYYYIAYAHARIHSIFKKYSEEKSIELEKVLNKSLENFINIFNDLDFSIENIKSNSNHFRRNLILNIAQFPEEIYESAIHFEPHRLANFLYKTAYDFARFYSHKENKIIEKQMEEAILLLYILNALRICIKIGLKLLGTNAPEKLEKES